MSPPPFLVIEIFLKGAWKLARETVEVPITGKIISIDVKAGDIVKEGDQIKVKVLEITKDGKIRLSHKAVLEENAAR